MLIPKYLKWSIASLNARALRKNESRPPDKGMNRLLSQLIVNPENCPNCFIKSRRADRNDFASDKVKITSSAYRPMIQSDLPHLIPLI